MSASGRSQALIAEHGSAPGRPVGASGRCLPSMRVHAARTAVR